MFWCADGGTPRGTTVGPFSTLAEAKALIRSSGTNQNMTTNVTVLVGSGTERVGSSPITFTEDDSASNGYRITYKSVSLGGHIIRGSAVVTGWTLYSGSIYRSQVGAGLSIHTLWEDGVRARKARYPKYVAQASLPQARSPYLESEGVATGISPWGEGEVTKLQYKSGDLSPGSWSLTDAEVYLWSGGGGAGVGRAWFTDTIPISSVNTTSRQFTLAHTSRYDLGIGARYYVQGVLDLLTEAGEFHYDSTAGYLYYWPNGSIASVTVEMPTTKRVIEFAGSSESDLVTGIALEGFEISQSNFTNWYRHAYPDDGDSGEGHTYPEYDRQMTMPASRQGLVYMENAENCRLERCHLKNSGYSAIYGFGYLQRNYIAHCWIEKCGHSGIYIDGKYPGEGDVSANNVIFNCKIEKTGDLVGHGEPIALLNTRQNTVANCELRDCPRHGYFLGAYTGISPKTDIYARGNYCGFTKILDAGQDSGDMGALNVFGFSSTTGGPYATNFFAEITIDGVEADASMGDSDPHGGMADDETYGQNYSNVNVANVAGAGLEFFNHNSAEHTNTNVKWVVGFNAALLSTRIGLTAAFPF